MLTLSQISNKASEQAKTTTYKSIQRFVVEQIVKAKKALTRNEVFEIVVNYTLRDDKQRYNHFKNDDTYNVYMNELSALNDKSKQNEIDAFATKHKTLIADMNKKTNDLFFSTSHARSIANLKSNNATTLICQSQIKSVDGKLQLVK